MTDHDLEHRLQRYGDILDQAAEGATMPAPAVTPAGRPRRLTLAAAFAVTAALAVGGAAIVSGRGGDGGRAVAPAGSPDREAGALPRLLIDGWKVDRADESDGAMSDRAEAGYLQVFSDPGQGHDGAMLSVNSYPGSADPGPPQGRPVEVGSGQAAGNRNGPLWGQVTWLTGEGHRVVVTGARVDDDSLDRVVGGLQARTGGGWEPSWLPGGLTATIDEATPAPERYHSAETTFVRDGDSVDLHLNAGGPAALQSLIEDRLNSADDYHSGETMGRTVAVTRYAGNGGLTAMWVADGVVYELRSDSRDEDPFEDALRKLNEVGEEEWEDALPASSVPSSRRAKQVDRMLREVPLPPGFDVDALKRGKATSDQYQLGAKVAGSVACEWFGRLEAARTAGDDAAAAGALEALQTSREWPVLKAMVDQSDYPTVLWDYVDAAAAGPGSQPEDQKHLVDYRQGLGCS